VLLLEELERRRVLRIDDIGRRTGALGHDLVGEHVLVVVRTCTVIPLSVLKQALTSASVVCGCWPL